MPHAALTEPACVDRAKINGPSGSGARPIARYCLNGERSEIRPSIDTWWLSSILLLHNKSRSNAPYTSGRQSRSRTARAVQSIDPRDDQEGAKKRFNDDAVTTFDKAFRLSPLDFGDHDPVVSARETIMRNATITVKTPANDSQPAKEEQVHLEWAPPRDFTDADKLRTFTGWPPTLMKRPPLPNVVRSQQRTLRRLSHQIWSRHRLADAGETGGGQLYWVSANALPPRRADAVAGPSTWSRGRGRAAKFIVGGPDSASMVSRSLGMAQPIAVI